MLNPEFCEYNSGKVKVGFTDDNADHCLTLYLSEKDAQDMAEMIISTIGNSKHKDGSKKREQFDANF